MYELQWNGNGWEVVNDRGFNAEFGPDKAAAEAMRDSRNQADRESNPALFLELTKVMQ